MTNFSSGQARRAAPKLPPARNLSVSLLQLVTEARCASEYLAGQMGNCHICTAGDCRPLGCVALVWDLLQAACSPSHPLSPCDSMSICCPALWSSCAAYMGYGDAGQGIRSFGGA
ncbi:hypothetical protein WJX79_004417 [Trebouxia sp. C0005]